MATSSATTTVDLPGPTEASRIKGFATFFKSYMSVWALVVAALPIPVGYFQWIPTFDAQRKYLSVYTSLFCFLSLAFIFFQRHRLGYFMFHEKDWAFKFPKIMFHITRGIINWLPLVCIALSIYAVFAYHNVLNGAVLIAQAQTTASEQKGTLPNAFLFEMSDSAEGLQLETDVAQGILSENQMTVVALKERIDPELFPPAASEADRKAARYKELSSATISEAKAKAERYKPEDAKDKKWGKVGSVASSYLADATSLGGYDAFLKAKEFIGDGVRVPSRDEVLNDKKSNVPGSTVLMAWYLIIFVAAETAFILMALKEYLQDLAHIPDLALMGMEERTKSAAHAVTSARTTTARLMRLHSHEH